MLVENDANRQLINGLSQPPWLMARSLQLLQLAGAWKQVLGTLIDPFTIQGMNEFGKRHLLLLIDFDEQFANRWGLYQQHKATLAPHISDRTYLLGCLHEPEKLKASCKYAMSIEKLGRQLSDDCASPTAENVWRHQHLQHNADQLNRLVLQVKPFLFKA